MSGNQIDSDSDSNSNDEDDFYQFIALDEDAIDKHIEKHIGECDTVIHGFNGDLHVYVVKPTEDRPFFTLITAGLSGFQMPLPETVRGKQRKLMERCELMVYLPPDWQMPPVVAGWDAASWPITMMKAVAKYLVTENTFICPTHGFKHIRENQLPLTDESLLRGLLIVSPIKETQDFAVLKIGRAYVNFNVVVPLTDDEFELKQKMGFAGLVRFLDDGSLPVICDAQRKSCALKTD